MGVAAFAHNLVCWLPRAIKYYIKILRTEMWQIDRMCRSPPYQLKKRKCYLLVWPKCQPRWLSLRSSEASWPESGADGRSRRAGWAPAREPCRPSTRLAVELLSSDRIGRTDVRCAAPVRLREGGEGNVRQENKYRLAALVWAVCQSWFRSRTAGMVLLPQSLMEAPCRKDCCLPSPFAQERELNLGIIHTVKNTEGFY